MSGNVQWEKPERLIVNKMPAFPINVFPDWIKDFTEGLSRELNTQVDLAATAVLSVLSTSLVRKYQFKYENLNWVLDLNLYLLLGTDPGSKKDTMLKRVFKILMEMQKAQLENLREQEPEILSELDIKKSAYDKLINKGKEDDEDKIKQLKKEIMDLEKSLFKKMFIISGDITQERVAELLKINEETLTIATAEASEMFDHLDGKYKVDSIDIYLKGWEGTSYDKLRSSTEDVSLEHPLLSLCLFTQPQEVLKLKKHEGRGLLQRFLLSVPERFPKEKISLNNKMYNSLSTTFEENVKKLYELKSEKTPKTITVDPNAWDDFENLYLDIIHESYEDVTYSTQQWLMKACGNIIKVVCLIKLTECIIEKNQKEYISLEKEDIERAKLLFDYYYTHFKKVAEEQYKSFKESELEFFFKRLIQINRDFGLDGKLSSTIINNNIKRINNEQREIMYEKLQEYHLIKINQQGRKKTIELNPEIKKMSYKDAIRFVRTNIN